MKRGHHPSLPGFLFLILAVLIPPLSGYRMVNADGDPARHLRHGDTILRQADVIRTDSFLLMQSGKPFVGFESGSQVLLALSDRIGGTVGVASLATLVGLTAIVMLLSWLLRRGVDPLLTLLATAVAAMLAGVHWLARPHIFSWPLLLLLFFWLERQRRPPLWWFGVLFAVWANLHGAFVLGWVIIGMYLAGHAIEAWWSRESEEVVREKHRAAGLVPVLIISVLATMVNPYGWQLPWHVMGFFGDPWIPRLTQEFQSPDFLREDRLFLFSLIGVITVLAFCPRPRWTHLVLMLGTTAMALISSRNIVQFGLLAIPVAACALADPWRLIFGKAGLIKRFGDQARAGLSWPYLLLGVTWLLGLTLSRGRVAGRQLVPEGLDPARYPVEAVSWARSHDVRGRLYHEFIWGGYLLYAWPEQKVFIDGGSDFYGGDYLRAYTYVSTLQSNWRDSLDTWRIDLTLLPPTSPMTAELLREAEWTPLYCDQTAVLLKRGEPLPTEPKPRASCGPEQTGD